MRVYLTSAVGVLMLMACRSRDRDAVVVDSTTTDSAATAMRPDNPTASAVMRDASGHELGTLTLTDNSSGITISGSLTGLPPGDHGIHLHMVGRCDAPSFESAGAHWNPTNKQHGTENPQGPHLGDMPNVTVGSDSTANIQVSSAGGGMLRSGPNMLFDTDSAAVVIHSGRDDMKTDPSGGSGSRIACGVVASQ